jgi:sulfur-oxidizing protein SoxY
MAGAATLAVIPIKALAAFARPQPAFDAKNIDSVFSAMGSPPEDSDLIELETPDIAENGAVVPVEVTSSIPGTSRIYIAIEMNPNPLAAAFAIPEGTEPYIATRVKVAQTCVIYAVVEANGKLYKQGRETKVTLGGCGG